MYPNSDSPYYLPGFAATVSLLVVSLLTYATLPICLEFEAKRRKEKTGHALPLQSLEDLANSQLSEAAMTGLQQLNHIEGKATDEAESFHAEEAKRSLPV